MTETPGESLNKAGGDGHDSREEDIKEDQGGNEYIGCLPEYGHGDEGVIGNEHENEPIAFDIQIDCNKAGESFAESIDAVESNEGEHGSFMVRIRSDYAIL